MSAKPPGSELSRELTLFQITMMGMGMMIGAGVFLGIGNAIAVAGPGGVLLTFGLNMVLAMLTAMSYAELSSAVPRAGGAYNFARMAFGRGPSFMAGWMEWFASSVAGSVYTLTFSIYTIRYLETLGLLGFMQGHTDAAVKIMAVVVALVFLYINYRGASETGKVGAFFTLGQTLFLVAIGIVGVVVTIRDPSRLANFQPFLPNGWSKLLVTMGFTYVAFEGFEVIAQAGDEAIDPRRNLPKAMLYSVFVTGLVYVAVSFASVVAVKAGSADLGGMVPWQWIGQFKERGFGEAVGRLMPAANLLLTLAVIFASTSALNATIYSATRASYALGRDHMLPPALAKVSKTRKTPWVALSATGVIVIVVATCMPTLDVASSASIMFLFLFFMVNLCTIKIRRNMRDELTYGFMVPLFPLFPIVAILCQAVLAVWLVHMSWIAWIVAPSWIALGGLIYLGYSRYHTLASEEEIIVFEEKKAITTDQYRVMIPVANPVSAAKLVGTAFRVCKAKQAAVELLHMVPVPEQVPLTDADSYMRPGRKGILDAMDILAPRFPVSTTLRYCRNIARGIISAVREKHIDLLILGWRGPRARSEFVLGATLDSVVERVPCNVIIQKGSSEEPFRRILVPVAGGPNSAFALEVACIVADREEGEVIAFTVRDGRREFDIEALLQRVREQVALPPERLRAKVVEAPNGLDAIMAETDAAEYDLVVLGTTREPLLRRMIRDTLPNRVARRCTKPLMMVKASGGLRSWLNRWI